MIDYFIVSLSEALEVFGCEEMLKLFGSFKCSAEKDLEIFLSQRSIEYERDGKGKTFLVIDKYSVVSGSKPRLIAYYTLANTSIDLSNFSDNKKKKVVGSFPNRTQRTSFPAFLIGQLGRDENYSHEDISGEILLSEVYHSLKQAAKILGGKLVVLECREHMYDLVYKNLGFKKLDDNLNSEGLYMLYSRVNFENY